MVKTVSFRIDSELLDKLHVVAAYEERSINGQLLILVRKCVNNFEENFGPIEVGDKKGRD